MHFQDLLAEMDDKEEEPDGKSSVKEIVLSHNRYITRNNIYRVGKLFTTNTNIAKGRPNNWR